GYSKQRSRTGLTEGGKRPATGGGKDKQSVTRSEEEVEVGKRPVEAGSARLRKWVETEPVALDVELQREVARGSRERIDQAAGERRGGIRGRRQPPPVRPHRHTRPSRGGSECRQTSAGHRLCPPQARSPAGESPRRLSTRA